MPTESPLTLVNTLARKTQQVGVAPPGSPLGTQTAFVRALVDEVASHHPEDRLVVSLREQLSDELTWLAHLIERSTGASQDALSEYTRAVDVLVVDDEEEMLCASTTALRILGYPCRTARNGEEALREFERRPAEIVLSDWQMPGMSGLELCAMLKRHERPPYMILVTAFHDNARLLDGIRGGADDFLRKPIDLDDLAARLLSASHLIEALRTVTRLGERLRAEARP